MFKKLVWTKHAEVKMRYYRLSEARVKRVMNMPLRIEAGIAPKTVAMLQRAGSKKHPYEIWVMIDEKKNERRVVSAWRYPGLTKPGESLPEEILREIKEAS